MKRLCSQYLMCFSMLSFGAIFGCAEATPVDVGYDNSYDEPDSPGSYEEPTAVVIPDHDSSSTCNNHKTLALNESIQDSTSHCDIYKNSCGSGQSAVSECLSILELKATEVGLYDISIEAAQDTGWGFFSAPACDTALQFQNSCVIQEFRTSAVETALLNPGSRFMFIGPLATSGQNVDYSAKMQKSDAWICADYQTAAQFIEIRSGEQRFEGSNDSGQGESLVRWASAYDYGDKGCHTQGSGGKERAYLFHLDQKTTVNARLEFSETSDTASGHVAIYINSCKANDQTDPSRTQKCSDASASDGELQLSVSLQPGDYGLFVDASDEHLTFNYSLTISGE